jgi:hypothetical protein
LTGPGQVSSYVLERHVLTARRYFAWPTAAHRRELECEREAVRDRLAAGEKLSREALCRARRAAARERARDRLYRLCFCRRCSGHRSALKVYTLGFKDGALGRIGKRRFDADLRSFKKHFQAGLADGRRAREEASRAYEERLSTRL